MENATQDQQTDSLAKLTLHAIPTTVIWNMPIKEKDGVKDINVPGIMLPTVLAKTHIVTMENAETWNLMLDSIVQLMKTANL